MDTPGHKEARELIAFYLDAGADALLGEEPVDRMADEAPPPAAAPSPLRREAEPLSRKTAAPIARPVPVQVAAPALPEAVLLLA